MGASGSPEVQITSHPSNDWEPRIGVDSRGKAHIVWDSYRNGNYDVYMRSWETGSMGPLVRVAGTPRFEAHASVVVDREDRVWVAWDEAAVNWAKDTGPTDDPGWLERGQEVFSTWIDQPASPGARIYSTRRVQIAVFEGNQRESTVQALDAALADAGIYDHDYPQLFLDPASGHIALLFHRWGQFDKVQSLGLKWAFWEHAVTFYEGDRWSRPYTLLESWGRPSMRSHGAYGPNGTLWLVWPTDERNYQPQLERQGTTFSQPAGNPVMNVHAGRIRSDKSPSRLELATWQEPDPIAYDPVHPEEADQVQKIRSYRAVIEGREHRILRGDLHRHTEFSWDSRGGNVDGSVFDYYRYMLDAGAMDFGGITDHNSGGDWEYAWWLIEKSSDLFHIPRAFTTFYAYERSVQWPDGHRNVFHTRRGVPVVSYFTRPDFQYPRPGIGAQSKDVMEADIPSALRVASPNRWTLDSPHDRLQHGNQLEIPRSRGGAGRGDLSGRQDFLRARRCTPGSTRRRGRSAGRLAGNRDSVERLSQRLPDRHHCQLGSLVHPHFLRYGLYRGCNSRGHLRSHQETAYLRSYRQHRS